MLPVFATEIYEWCLQEDREAKCKAKMTINMRVNILCVAFQHKAANLQIRQFLLPGVLKDINVFITAVWRSHLHYREETFEATYEQMQRNEKKKENPKPSVFTCKWNQWLVPASNLQKANKPPQFCSVSPLSSSCWKVVWSCFPYSTILLTGKWKMPSWLLPQPDHRDSVEITGALGSSLPGALSGTWCAPFQSETSSS